MNIVERRCIRRRSIEFWFRHLDKVIENDWKWAAYAIVLIIIVHKAFK